jgi:peptidoglycan/LPS O-acetylase OafA/YrhL
MNYRAEIDGLRALAVLPVIFFHAGFEWLSGGFIGVDVFFVISGYLITTIIITELAREKFSIVNFYERRARRILPALFFVMLISLPFAWFILTPDELTGFGKGLVAVATFSSNILFWLGAGYFAESADLNPLLHTWSLAVEEQFYIFFPIFMLLTWRIWRVKWILILLIVVFISSLGVAHWASVYGFHQKISSGSFFLLPTRVWELLIGIFVAFHLKYNGHFKVLQINNFLSFAGIGMVIFSIFFFSKNTPFPSIYALIPTIGTGLIILAGTPETFANRVLSRPYIVAIGLISYSAYLWHQPILAFSRHFLGIELTNLLKILLIGLTIVMAYLSYRYIEKPFRDKKITPKKVIFIFSVVGIVVFSILGLLIVKEEGFSNRYPILSQVQSKLLWPTSNNNNDKCIEKFGGDQYCVVGNANYEVNSLLLGDSHANHFFIGLKSYLEKRKDNLLMIGAGGCPPLIDIDMGYIYKHGANLRCYDRTNLLYKNIIRDTGAKKVYLAFDDALLFDLKISFLDIREELDFSGNRYKAVISALKRTIDYFNQQNVEVIIIEDMPDVTFSEFKQCLFKKDSFNDCLVELKIIKNDFLYEKMLNELENLGVEILRTKVALKYFPFDNLEIYQAQNLLYRDSTHLSEFGSKYVIESSLTTQNP